MYPTYQARQRRTLAGTMNVSFEYVFPAICGVQAQREYYVSMCPLRLIPKIFLFDEEELVPSLRAQRTLNRARLPEMCRYVLDNPTDYVFSAITASIDGEVRFEPLGSSADSKRIGLLHIPMAARFVINDGQHRRAAIEMAIRENPDIGDESIAVVFFLDRGLARCQQMFADLNRNAVRPSKSLGVLYDYRDEMAIVVKRVVFESTLFNDLVEMERSTLSARSRRLFTLSAIYGATAALLANAEADASIEQRIDKAKEFWTSVAQQFTEWDMVRHGKMSAQEVRRDFIHSHGIVLHALGRVGNALFASGDAWKRKLRLLRKLDWSRSNGELWEGRALSGGRVSKAGNHVILTTNVLKKHLDLPLTDEEERIEQAFLRGEDGNNREAA